MKISIIIPVYNSEQYVRRLLNSIICQTYVNYEVIIINDGSSDNSEKIIKEYVKKNSKIKYYNQENMGPGIARKNGFLKASGDLLFFVDSDDYLPNENVLKDIADIYKNYKFDILFFNYCRKNQNVIVTNILHKKNIKEGMYNLDLLSNDFIGGALWGKIFRADLMQKEFFCDSDNFEDYYTTYKYLEKCKNFFYTSKILYYANRDNDGSISKKKNIYKMLKTMKIAKEIHEFSRFKNATEKLLLDSYIMASMYMIKNKKKEYLPIIKRNVNINIKNIFSLGFLNSLRICFILINVKIVEIRRKRL